MTYSVADRGVGEWGNCPGHQGRGHQREGEQNNANLHNEKHAGGRVWKSPKTIDPLRGFWTYFVSGGTQNLRPNQSIIRSREG